LNNLMLVGAQITLAILWTTPRFAEATEWNASSLVGPSIYHGENDSSWGALGEIGVHLPFHDFWEASAALGTSLHLVPDASLVALSTFGGVMRYKFDVFRYVPYATLGAHYLRVWNEDNGGLSVSSSLGVERRWSREWSTGIDIRTHLLPMSEFDSASTTLGIRFVRHFRF
jgi:hypothetical protein